MIVGAAGRLVANQTIYKVEEFLIGPIKYSCQLKDFTRPKLYPEYRLTVCFVSFFEPEIKMFSTHKQAL